MSADSDESHSWTIEKAEKVYLVWRKRFDKIDIVLGRILLQVVPNFFIDVIRKARETKKEENNSNQKEDYEKTLRMMTEAIENLTREKLDWERTVYSKFAQEINRNN